ncbi:PAS domain S-box protein [Natrialbaceae archaeon A-CW1-1]
MTYTAEKEATSILTVGSAPWLETVDATAPDDTDTAADETGQPVSPAVSIYGPVSSLEAGRTTLDGFDEVDCILTDDAEVVPSVTNIPVIVGPPGGATDGRDPIADETATEVTVGSTGVSEDASRSERAEEIGADEAACVAHLESALEAGAAAVVTPMTAEQPTLLRQRIDTVIDRESSRRALEKRETWYQTLIEKSPALFLVLDDDCRVTFTGPSIEHVAGYDPETILGSRIDERIHDEDRNRFRQAFEGVVDAGVGESTSCEYKYRHADGTWHVHEAVITNRLGGDVVGGIVLSVRDITAYRRVEQELSKSFDRVTDAFLSLDAEWRFTYVNDQAEHVLGKTKAELLGRHLIDAFPKIEGTPFERESLAAMKTQEPRTIESYYEPLERWFEARMYPSPSGLSIYFKDVSTRVERERTLADRSERLQVLIENVPVVFFSLDETGTFTLSEGHGLERIGYEPNEVAGESIYDVYSDHPGILQDVNRAFNGEAVHSFRLVSGRSFETWYRPVVSGDTVERVIGIGVDVTERQQYDETLNTLYEATQHLLTVETKQVACEYIVDVATDVLDLENVAVYRFDEHENELVPAAYTTNLLTRFGTPPRFGPNSSIAWNVFVAGETAVYDDVRESEHVYDSDATVRSGLFVPLGEHGVLVALTADVGSYETDVVDLAQVFGATAEAALDRISRTERLHEREQELKRQNEHLAQLNDASSLREDIESLLLRAESRAEIEAGICDRLVDIEGCSYAWIGEPDPGGNQIVANAEAGYGRGYLEAVTVTAVDDVGAEPTGRTARTLQPTSIDNVGSDLRHGKWRTEALSRDFQSVYAVPMVYDDFLYGVISVYSTDHTAFDDPTRSTLAELGETIAYAIDAVQRKRALLGDETTEIELEIPAETPLSTLSQIVDGRVDLEGVLPQEDGTTIVFASVEGSVEPEELESINTVASGSVITRDDDRTVVQLTLTETFLSSIVDSHGGALREFTTHHEEGTRTTLEVPHSVDVRDVLSDINRRGLSASLVARREHIADDGSSIDPTRPEQYDELLGNLTDRQREVVQTAYHGGFFDWPRATTGEDLATSLDISPPAFHNHVRTVERKVFAALFDGERADG